jgi:hypothetical protein
MSQKESQKREKYKGITNDSIYDASCMLTSLSVWDLETLSACFLLYDVAGLHLYCLTCCPDESFHDFHQALEVNARVVH